MFRGNSCDDSFLWRFLAVHEKAYSARGAFDETSWAFALVLKSPTEKRKFLVGVPGQERGGGGVGLGGGWVEWEGGPKHGPFGGTWWECASGSFWLGSWDSVESEGGGGAGGGGGSGAGEVGWSGRGVPSAELLMRLRGHARWF